MFPTVTETGGNDANNFTTRQVTIPSANEGDLLIVCVCNDGTATQTWTHDQGFTNFVDSPTGTWRMVIKYLVVGPVLDTTITVDTNAAEQCSWSILRIAKGTYQGIPEVTTPQILTSASPNPDPITPSWGIGDTLFMTVLSIDDPTMTYNSGPSGYTMGTFRLLNNNQAEGVRWGWKAVRATSDDPGTHSLNVARNVQMVTMALREGVKMVAAVRAIKQAVNRAAVM
jgi:hypothetical protein